MGSKKIKDNPERKSSKKKYTSTKTEAPEKTEAAHEFECWSQTSNTVVMEELNYAPYFFSQKKTFCNNSRSHITMHNVGNLTLNITNGMIDVRNNQFDLINNRQFPFIRNHETITDKPRTAIDNKDCDSTQSSTENLEDQEEHEKDCENLEDQEEHEKDCENLKDQEEHEKDCENLEDQEEHEKDCENLEDQEEHEKDCENLKDQEEHEKDCENLEDQEEHEKDCENLKDQEEHEKDCENLEDQEEHEKDCENLENQEEHEKDCENLEDQEEHEKDCDSTQSTSENSEVLSVEEEHEKNCDSTQSACEHSEDEEKYRFSLEICLEQLVEKFVKKSGIVISPERIFAIYNRLTNKIWAEIRGDIDKIPLKKLKNFHKVIFKALCKRWKDPELILEIMESDIPRFDDKIVDIFIEEAAKLSKKPGCIRRFFSFIGRLFCCTRRQNKVDVM
ncbi:unnamed protein product [Oreochromis niloticus]|nr:unnamed protein product [Mustela putorius furo]